MPLVTGNNKITVPFDADSDKLVAETNKVIAQLDRVKQKVQTDGRLLETQAKNESEALKKSTMSITDFRSAYQVALDVVRVGQVVWDEVGQKYVDNAVLVGNFARALGTTTEEASRLKEIADDVGVSTNSLKVAFRTALKDGFEPSIDGLARMSDEYLKLAPGTERMQYLMDRFGKSGEEMGKLLEKGGASIRSMSAAMDEGLIVTEEAYKQARQYQISVDALNDSWDAFTYKVAPPLVNALTKVLNYERDVARAKEIAREQDQNTFFMSGETRRALLEQAAAERELADAQILATQESAAAGEAFEDEAEKSKRLAEEAKAAEEAIREMTKANQEELDTLGRLTDILNNYTEKESDLKAEHAELLAKKDALIKQGWWAESDAVLDVNEKLAENEQKQRENADEFEAATNRRILARAEELASIDGLTTEEKNALIERGTAMGVYTQEAAAKMRQEEKAAQDLARSLNGIPNVNRTVTITTLQVVQNATGMTVNGQQRNYKGRASGGPVSAGTPYMVGERGPEMIVPSQSGNVVPNNDLSNLFDPKVIKRAVRDGVVAGLTRGGG